MLRNPIERTCRQTGSEPLAPTLDRQLGEVMRILRLPDIWSRIEPWEWLEHMSPPSRGLQSTADLDFTHLLKQLRAYAPPGTTESHQIIPVILLPGKVIGEHKHPEWTLIYFIDAEQGPIIVDGVRIYPANNTALLLQPMTPHEVARNHMPTPRLSLALRFKDAK